MPMLKTLVQQDIEGGVPPSAVKCRSRILMIQDVRLGFGKVVVIVVTTLQLKEDHSAGELRVSAAPEQ